MGNIVSIESRISCDADIAGGQPRLAGRRITVKQIVIWHDLMGKSPEEIAAEYELTLSEIYAALYYFHENPEEILETIRLDKDFITDQMQKTPSRIKPN